MSHGTLLNLPPNCTKFVCFFATTNRYRKSAFPQNDGNAKSIKEMVMEN